MCGGWLPSESARGSAANGNKLSGALPAALGALTALELLCARPLGARREGPARGGKARRGPLRRSDAVLRSELSSNGLTGTIGSWIGSLAKLKLLYARPSPARE
jgi:hypothetical protein